MSSSKFSPREDHPESTAQNTLQNREWNEIKIQNLLMSQSGRFFSSRLNYFGEEYSQS
jgi:hypothetical protein